MVDLMKEDQIRPGSDGFVPKLPLAVERASVKRTRVRRHERTRERQNEGARKRWHDITIERKSDGIIERNEW